MSVRGFHKPVAQSRARLFDRAGRSGSDFSPLVDAFHPSFPASVEDYISETCELNTKAPTLGWPANDNNCLDGCPCHGNRFGNNARCRVNNASMNWDSAETDSASDAHRYHAEGHGDTLSRGTNGLLFKLPSEVSDLILSYLSPAALDAARHTCKGWRTKILSNTWVLASVLGVEEKTPPLDASPGGKISHRDLLKNLDCDSDLPATSQHPDAWRTRFRTRNLEFSIPSPSSTLTRPAFVAATRTGTQNGFLAFQLQDSAQSTGNRLKNTLVIYRFDSADLPWYAGSIHDVGGQGALRIMGVAEVRRHAEWVLKIEIGDTAGLYSLTARKAFSKSDSRFSLTMLKPLEKVPGISPDRFTIQGVDGPPEPLPSGDQSWNVLTPFPPNGGLRHVCFSEGLRKHTEPRFLAEQTKTGNIHVIMEVDPSEKPSQYASYSQSKSLSNGSERGNHYFTGTALLSRPRPNSVYKNVAVAPTTVKDGSIRAAIVWQSTDLEEPISELYIYDIPEAIYYEPCRSYNQKISVNVSATSEEFGEGAILRPCRLVQGKRVTSLDQHMGGTHPCSPLYRRAFPQETALGGLQFPHTTENQETYPRNVQYQKCFAWGPATSDGACTQISFKVFDFSFADPQRLHSLITYGVGAGQRRDQKNHNIALNALHCACALHDDAFRIVVPDVTIVEAKPAIKHDNAGESAPSWLAKPATPKEILSFSGIGWSFWPRKPTSAPDSVPSVGSLSRDDSLARRAALERRQEWLRGRILGMKRAGLTDFEIAELWNLSAWTQYGQVRKPEGWQELGKGHGGECG